jgi:hypothetical protein
MMGGMGGQGMPEAGTGGSGMMGGTGARGMPEGQMGPGMMGGMAGHGMPGGGMRQRMMRHGQMAMGGGMMGCPMMGAMDTPGVLYGTPHDVPREMTPARVRAFLEQHLEWHGNSRLKIGEISAAEGGNITAEIVTVDGSLVQKFAFNRYPGLFRHITE